MKHLLHHVFVEENYEVAPHIPESPFAVSNMSISFLSISALKPLNALSILDFVSGSFVIVLFAALAPVSSPVSPPRNTPAIEKKV